MPVAAASSTNASVTSVGYGVYPTVLRPRSSICRHRLGIASRSAASRSHGSSPRKRRATSYVAPPQHSTLSSCGVVRATCGATATRSRVRTRVASSDWCASRNVVSVTATSCCSRSARGEALGPSASRRCRQPSGGAARPSRSSGGQLVARVDAHRRRAVRAVHGDVGEPGAAACCRGRRSPRASSRSGRSSMKRRRHVAGGEVRLGEHGLQEADVRAARRGSGTRPARAAPGGPRSRKSRPAADQLHQHRVEVRADRRAGVRRCRRRAGRRRRRASGRW